jgi:prepilin-type N-terminal cleavage/methylation domain-containing protein
METGGAMLKNRKIPRNGFTLTEAIVVATIIAILAVVAIPLYTGYVQRAKYNGAKGACELTAAAITYNHNRGLSIKASSAGGWDDIGIANPSDRDWTYTFPAIAGNAAINNSYKVTVAGNLGTYYFFLRPSGNANQWTGP